MERMVQLAMLYDFYGELLTKKQRVVFEMSHFNDMSLAETAHELGITPQGVRDSLIRTEKILGEYESALQLVNKHADRKKIIEEISGMIDGISANIQEKSLLYQKLEELL